MAKKITENQLIFDAIRRVVRSLRTFSKSTEREVGLGTAQIYVLQQLSDSERPLSINELAERTMTHQSSVSVVVSKLHDRKLIERNVDKHDSRSIRLNITKEGKYLLSKSPTSIQERLAKALSKMSPKERKGLVDGLTALIENAGMKDDEAPMLMEDGEKE